jgi:hypothetical protein
MKNKLEVEYSSLPLTSFNCVILHAWGNGTIDKLSGGFIACDSE